MKDELVTLQIGKAEALILFELLADFCDQSALQISDNAEKLALIRLHGALEKSLVEPFSQKYKNIIEEAKAQLLREWGDS
jgi:hypothetical protein